MENFLTYTWTLGRSGVGNGIFVMKFDMYLEEKGLSDKTKSWIFSV